MTRTIDRLAVSPSVVLVLLCSFFLFLSGCATQQVTGPKRVGQDVYVDIDAPDVMVEPYVPIDDGMPLTKAELAAFNSTGELDTNLSQDEKQLVELFFKSYVHNYRGTVERFLKRSEVYMPFVEQVFRERKLPVELSCLAYVESGFNPNAVSRAGATGMWQFMPFTGKKYGLSQDRWMDERRDPYKATHAAADYLTKLYEYFDNDWHLAIAAYNAGEGKIGRALAGTDSKTFFEICRKNEMLDNKAQLKEETQQYLPRFLAFTKILRNLETLGFTRPDPQKAPQLATVTIPAGVDLRRFARDIKLDWEQFKGLNPAYLRSISPPGSKSEARIPEARVMVATEWLAQKDIAVYAGWRDYRVKRGDSMGKIAQRTGASTALLRQANGRTSNSLRVGEDILVPGSTRAARSTMKILDLEDAPAIARAKDGKPLGGYSGTHAIEPGDTLYALALAWDSSVDDICLLNDLEPSARLRVGQKLYIPSGKNIGALAAKPVERTPEARPAVSLASSVRGGKGTYVAVQKGDTLSSLARAHGVSVEDICNANGITPKTSLAVGRELHILPGAARTQAVSVKSAAETAKPVQTAQAKPKVQAHASAAGAAKVAVVQSGDTLYSLARAHGTSVAAIAKRNGIDPSAKLKLGQVIQLP
ncbi:Lytic transglycosylase catalytic [uncultured delta proteobacterium]|uniref:Lytic transglycosylase catalytic n=1 Tax=uncultured delta proteobacterium TaxID=34034 RepID=A0A212JX98_9DELT|nr:Lytic transglycosylase catalytic [uncultured delta proteobacterium]